LSGASIPDATALTPLRDGTTAPATSRGCRGPRSCGRCTGGRGRGGIRRAGLPAAVAGELSPPVPEHPVVKFCDLCGGTREHDEVRDARGCPVINCNKQRFVLVSTFNGA